MNWNQWLSGFRQWLIETSQWTEQEAAHRIRDGWIMVRDGRLQEVHQGEALPADAVRVFSVLTPGGRKWPIQIHERLTGLVSKALSSDRAPKDVFLGLLAEAEHPGEEHEGKEIRAKRDAAVYWMRQPLGGCEDPVLAGVKESDALWRVVLSAFQAGRRHQILELYKDPQLLADLLKAQMFQSGRSPDELTRRLGASYHELRAKSGRHPKPHEIAKAAGGVWSKTEACWLFGTQPIGHAALRDRLKDIRRRHP
jgi:hypothetical protein